MIKAENKVKNIYRQKRNEDTCRCSYHKLFIYAAEEDPILLGWG